MDKKLVVVVWQQKRQLTQKLQKRLHSHQALMYARLDRATSIPNVYWYQFDV